MSGYIKFENPEKAEEELHLLRSILNNESSEVGALLQNILEFVEHSKEAYEQAKESCKAYFRESPKDISPTEYGAHLDTAIFATYFLANEEYKVMGEIWPKIEQEAADELKNA